jgi:PAS domain S-box-containing protein
LVVHQNADVRRSLCALLSDRGYRPVEAETPAGIPQEEITAADCALLGSDLVELAAGWFANRAETGTDRVVPVLVVSAASAGENSPRRLPPGVRGCITWPAEPDLVLSQVEFTVSAIRQERRLQRLVEDTFSRTGPEFFSAAVRFLAEELGADACMLAELIPRVGDRVRTLAYWRDGRLEENFEYDLKGTPCEQVVGRQFCIYSDGVASRFPQDQWLVEERARAYMGEPLFGADRSPLGLINAVFRRPLDEPPAEDRTLFRLVAARAAAELERERASRALAESGAKFAALFRGSPIPTVLVRLRDRMVLDANRAWLEMFGLERADVVGRSTGELPLRLDEELRRELAQKLAAGGSIRDLEIPLYTRGRERLWLLSSFDVVDLEGEQLLIATFQNVTELRLAQQQLRESEERFRRLIEYAPEAVVLLDVETGRFVFANRAAERLFKLAPEELAQRGPKDLSPPVQPDGRSSAEKAAEFIARAVSGELPVFEWVHRDGEGKDIPCEVRLLRLDLSGRVIVRGSIIDISERKAAEARMKRLNRVHEVLRLATDAILHEPETGSLLRSVCRVAKDAGGFALVWIGLVDEKGRLAVAAHAGAEDGETLRILRDLVEGPAPDCAFTFHALERGERAVCLDIARDERAASWREAALKRGYASMASFPIRVSGRVAGTLNLYDRELAFSDAEELRLLEELAADMGLALEIHEQEARRRAAEENLRRSEERFRQLIEYAPDMIHVIDEGGILLFQSPSAEQTLGYTAEEHLRKSVFELIHPEDVERATGALREAVSHPGKAIRVEYRLRHKDGSWRIVESVGRSLPELSPGGYGGYIVINSRDVTDTRRLEEEFRQAQKLEAVGRLAGGVAHDFNNLLTVILGNAQLWESSGEMPPEARDAFREIRESAERAASLTRQLLAFSRRQLMQLRDLDLNDVVAGMARMLRRIIGEDVDLRIELHASALTVRADPAMLEQALLNLAVNARDAMPEGGTLTIGTEQLKVSDPAAASGELSKGEYAVLRVTDTGVGIPPEHLPRIFEPFFTTKEVGKGTGLGLATVYGVAKQHGGTVRVRSRVGQGTTFEILLPLRPAEVGLKAEEVKERPKLLGGSETVLVVEDDPDVRSTVCSILERSGYRVLAASDGAEAQAVWKERGSEVDLVMTDLVMPGGLTGLELAQLLRRDRPGLRVLYVSGYSEEFAGRRIELGPGEHFLQKPFTLDSLLQAVRSALGT